MVTLELFFFFKDLLKKASKTFPENPILCQDELTELTGLMEAQETRLLGVAHCIVPVPKEDIPIAFVPQQLPSPPEIPIISTNIMNPQIISKSLLQPPPPIVQVIIPEPILTQSIQSKENEFAEKTETPVIITTTPSTTSTTIPTIIVEPVVIASPMIKSVPEISAIETVIASISTEPTIPSSSTTPNSSNLELNSTVNEIDNAVNLPSVSLQNLTVADTQVPPAATTPVNPTVSVVLEQQAVEVTTLPTSTATVTITESSSNQSSSSVLPLQTNPTPVLPVPTVAAEVNQPDTETSAPESDNYVYETFSSVPQVFGAMSDRTQAQQLVIVEEPPEMLKDGAEP